jgi:glycosyltransferase involved in cell wall biosynthesis
MPGLGKMHTLYGYAFSAWARLRAWWKFKVQREARPDLIYSVGWYLPQCDVAHVHFSHWDWERRQRLLGMTSMRDCYERVTNLMGRTWANLFLRKTTAKTVLTVSESVASDLRAVNPQLNVRVLPNCYDPRRFHSGVREESRRAMRRQLGFSDSDVVFVFVSAGHYRRKGFFLAAAAMAKLRTRHPNARLLVVGGREERVAALQTQLAAQETGWREYTTFTGNVPDVERYFAASDAFLFPSYSEAFALVEVEAAACGLPLFLTRHHGSEMILDDGVNGRFLEFDSDQIAVVLAEYVRGEWKPEPGIHLKQALDSEAYAQRFAAELSSVCRPSDDVRSLHESSPAPLAATH